MPDSALTNLETIFPVLVEASMADDTDEVYTNIRQILNFAIGQKIVDITQHDDDEWKETKQSYIMIMLENGGWIKFLIGDQGFITGPEEED